MGLSDMEELLSRINNKALVDYMREALGCYHVNAYRTCIVLSYITLFDDLSQKLQELAKTNATAKTIADEVKKRQHDQKIFESYMVDRLKTEKLITGGEAAILEQVRGCRNRAAHPSGIHASPEEAWFVFFEVIDKFLSKPLLLTTQAVDTLMIRLNNANFFPTKNINEIQDIVSEELENLHNSVFPYLIQELIKAFVKSNTNPAVFLVGLAFLKQDD